MPAWTDTELAYLAGFIDGEGSICVFGYHNRRHSALRLTAYNTNREVLEWIAFNFGGRVRPVKRRTPKNRPQFVWEISARPAATILLAIRPYLQVKAQQAELFLEVVATLQSNNTAVADNVLDFRRRIAARVSALNRGESNAG
jgi:hypothetical protein